MSLKNSFYAYISPYMNKTLPTLGNEKGQQQVEFYQKNIWRVESQNVLFHSPDWVSAQKVRLYHWTPLTTRIIS